MGLAALHIGQGRALPIFFYGQHYMGTLEAYLAAPLIALTGPSLLALRLPTLLLYVALLVGAYHLSRRLFTPGFAVATVGFLAFAADRTVKNQLIAGGGYPEGSPAAVALMLLAVGLGTGPRPAPLTPPRRLLAFAAWGLVAGLLVWNHWLGVPYLVAAAVVLVLGVRRELLGRAGLATVVGFLIGSAPLIAHNLRAPITERSPMVFRQLYLAGEATWPEQLLGGVLQGLPLGLGLCAPSHCTLWQLAWAPVLLVCAAGAAAGYAWAALRASGDERVRQVARLALILAAVTTLVSYVRSPAAGLTPVESARYLSMVVISVPAMVWPLWRWATTPARGAFLRRARRVAGAVPLAALIVTVAAATGSLLAQVATYVEQANRQRALLATLSRSGVTRFYTEYWTCNWVAFATRERAVCAVLTDELGPGLDRVPSYRAMVADASEPPAYVAPVPSRFDQAVRRHLTAAGVPFVVDDLAGYRVYRPTARIPPRQG